MILSQAELESFLNAVQSRPHDFLGMRRVDGADGVKGVVARAWLADAERCEVVPREVGEVPHTEDRPHNGGEPHNGGGGERRGGGDKKRDHGGGGVALAGSIARTFPLTRLHEEGFFEGLLPDVCEPFAYKLRVTGRDGAVRLLDDPYSFWPTLGELDLHLFNEGTEQRLHEKLGARPLTHQGVAGAAFAVWAPSARRVSLVGDFNGWDGRRLPMRMLGASGVWEIFVPGLAPGARYKFEILGPASPVPFLKSDPCALYCEPPPGNASILYDIARPLPGHEPFAWSEADAAWLAARARTDWGRRPVSIYEVHLGSWRRAPAEGNRPLTYRELARELPAYLRETGFTHAEFLPPAEHPFDGSWGYQVTGYYAPTQRFGTPHDFMFLVDALHRAGIGVIVDWVPAHFPRDDFALAGFDGTHLYEHADPRQGAHLDWGTLIFNYGRNEVRSFLTGSALSWFDRFHIDGLRVDAVASMLHLDYSRQPGEWIPNRHGGRENLEAASLLRHVNSLVHALHPGALTIAEESTSYPGVTRPVAHGGLGFDLKWNMGWMHDTLDYFHADPLARAHLHAKLTFAMLYQYSERFTQVFSHDEVVHGKASLLNKMPQDTIAARAQNLRALLAYLWAWPGKKTLFMGCEFGQYSEWKYDASLDWHLLQYPDHAGLQRLVRDLNHLYTADAALAASEQDPAGFRWLEVNDAPWSVLTFLRASPDARLHWLVACNFTPVPRDYRAGVPLAGRWQEVINTDSASYGGSGSGNLGGVETTRPARPWNDQPHSLTLHLPGQSVVILRKAEE